MAQTFPYCNINDDLQSVFPDIEKFQRKDTLVTFGLVSGQTNTYSKTNTGHVGAIWDDGVALTEQTSIANVESNAGSWWWDPTNDILYVHQTGAGDPDTSTIEAHGVGIWSAYKQRWVDRSGEQFEALLDKRYPRPLPFARRSYEGVNYDADIVIAVSLLTCSNIVKARDINNPLWKKLFAQVWDPENDSGIAWEYYKGRRAFSFEATKDEFVGNIKRTVVGTGSSGRIWVAGFGEQTNRRKVAIIITTGGAPGTAIFKYSLDNKTTYTENVKILNTHQYQHLADNIYLKFEGTFSITDNADEWELNTLGEESVTNPAGISSVDIRV
jgi:hypothetical protein